MDTPLNTKINTVLFSMTKTELSEELGITRPTLNSRLSGRSKWKTLEEKWLHKLYRDI
jgi:DNA-binding Xre family transcriptional regulator